MSDPIFDQVKRVFDRLGVPPAVWFPIMQAESGGNPNAIGDKGASIGLFQLNTEAGQGRGYTKEQLLDPTFNATVASQSIWSAYTIAVKPTYPIEKWASETARRSGHPGGSIQTPFNADDPRIRRIDDLAKKYLSTNPGSSNLTTELSDATEQLTTGTSNAIQQISDALAAFQSWLASIDFGALGLGALGVVLVVIALVTFKETPKPV